MKRLITILFLTLLVITSYGQDYWVSPRGNDANAGTDSSSTGAFLSWQKGFETAEQGDTVMFLGGTYLPTTTHAYTNGVVYINPWSRNWFI